MNETFHRLAPPILGFCICVGALAAVSHSIWMSGSNGAPLKYAGTAAPPALCSSVRVYHVPLLTVSSAAGLTVTIKVTDAQSLLTDVASGRIDTVVIGGTTWSAAPGPTNDSLLLTSHTVPCCPISIIAAGTTGTWTGDSGWGNTGGAGALVLAFSDTPNGAS